MGCAVKKERQIAVDISEYFVGSEEQDHLALSKEPIAKYYNFSKLLGKGNFGTVRKATLIRDPSKIYAIKTITKRRFISKLHILQRELIILKQMDHPNIVRFYETYQDDKYVYFVMEYCNGGEVFQRLVQKKTFSERQTLHIMKQLFSAVSYLHFHNITHRDIKPTNILFLDESQFSEVRLIDFGLGKVFSDDFELGTQVGTPLYVAPEILDGFYGVQCDDWSLGVLMYMLLCGQPPFYSESQKELYEFIKTGKITFEEPAWGNISQKAKSLIRELLQVDPMGRLSSQQALKHPWISSDIEQLPLKQIPQDPVRTIMLLRLYADSSSFKKIALRFFVNHMASKEIEHLHQKFIEFDLEQNGVITIGEMTQIMKNIGYKDTEQEIAQFLGKFHPSQREAINVVHINYSAFIAATLDTKRYLNQENLWVLFKSWDLDNTDIITLQNMRDVITREGRKITEEELQAIMKQCKGDVINFDQFCKIMQSE